MKSNSFVSSTAIVLIAHFITWFILIATTFGHWWRKCLNWYHQRKIQIRERQRRPIKLEQQQQQQGDENQNQRNMYQFRPFEVVNCNYKSYSRTSKGRGINIIPKARSGHRVAANEVDLFSFGGKLQSQIKFKNKQTNKNKKFNEISLFFFSPQATIQTRTVIYSRNC